MQRPLWLPPALPTRPPVPLPLKGVQRRRQCLLQGAAHESREFPPLLELIFIAILGSLECLNSLPCSSFLCLYTRFTGMFEFPPLYDFDLSVCKVYSAWVPLHEKQPSNRTIHKGRSVRLLVTLCTFLLMGSVQQMSILKV